jgi:regulator of protease activity HflC (stomatin/prohibitin superfamily)
MQFILIKEKQEAERKRIEAQGIQDFQKIVSQGISDQLLRWKGIEATSHLAESNNAKIIIVGGKDGLPIILNTETGGALGK